MKIKYLEVLEMDNEEIICLGKSLGFKKQLKPFLYKILETIQIPGKGEQLLIEAEME